MLYAHDERGVLTIDVAGPATMAESTAVHETASEQMSRGVRAVRIDLRDCAVMDSTFSGLLLTLKKELERCGGKLTLVSPSAKVVELISQMGLEGFYDVEEASPSRAPRVEIRSVPPSVERLKRLIVESHEELARVPGPAAEAFSEVVRELRR